MMVPLEVHRAWSLQTPEQTLPLTQAPPLLRAPTGLEFSPRMALGPTNAVQPFAPILTIGQVLWTAGMPPMEMIMS